MPAAGTGRLRRRRRFAGGPGVGWLKAEAIRALSTPAPAPAQAWRVKPLEWRKSHVSGWNDDWHTVPTAYTIRCADENGWKWSSQGAFGYSYSPEAAKSAAQADYTARILAALIPASEEGGS